MTQSSYFSGVWDEGRCASVPVSARAPVFEPRLSAPTIVVGRLRSSHRRATTQTQLQLEIWGESSRPAGALRCSCPVMSLSGIKICCLCGSLESKPIGDARFVRLLRVEREPERAIPIETQYADGRTPATEPLPSGGSVSIRWQISGTDMECHLVVHHLASTPRYGLTRSSSLREQNSSGGYRKVQSGRPQGICNRARLAELTDGTIFHSFPEVGLSRLAKNLSPRLPRQLKALSRGRSHPPHEALKPSSPEATESPLSRSVLATSRGTQLFPRSVLATSRGTQLFLSALLVDCYYFPIAAPDNESAVHLILIGADPFTLPLWTTSWLRT
ncbi:unnamed protein product [Cuscuta campestris]|uniref:Uncharacterized protein n=1 Tax=Cuscuta campestris TaxID=132261 RepID=A0A484M1T6_9ASTE|nr:unnamed protein product [Cuscuta campestris]